MLVDIPPTLKVSAYNQEEMDMRNQVSKNTADFVNERLAALGKELGLVEGIWSASS